MRLLLDIHHSPRAAEQLRKAGYNALAAAEDARLAALPDEDLLRAATADDRALVTENVKDFDRIVRIWASTGERHGGVIFTSPRRFHRARSSYPQDLVRALENLLAEPPGEQQDWVLRLS
jgi:predicted nucleic acid-binding protein